MNIIVCVKQVPDSETRIKLTSDCRSVDLTGVKFVINPYDEYALEEAIKLKEKYSGTVTMVTIGPDRAEEAIRTGLAMGADSAIHLKEEMNDALTTAKTLSLIISKMQYDIIFCGKQAIDDDSSTVCSALAEYLGIPNVNIAMKIEVSPDKKRAVVRRQIEGGEEIVETTLPAVISCQKGLNVPRYPTLPSILKAKKKEIKLLTLGDIGLKKEELVHFTSALELSPPPQRKPGKIVEGDTPQTAAEKLVKVLREVAKVV